MNHRYYHRWTGLHSLARHLIHSVVCPSFSRFRTEIVLSALTAASHFAPRTGRSGYLTGTRNYFQVFQTGVLAFIRRTEVYLPSRPQIRKVSNPI